MFARRLAIPLLVAVALGVGAVALPSSGSAQDPLTERKAGFNSIRKALGEVKGTLDGSGPVTAAADPADRIAAFAARIPSLFPAGSNSGKTEAAPAVWSDPNGFASKAKDLETAAKGLSDAAKSGDKAATAKQFAAVANACASCHKAYRQ